MRAFQSAVAALAVGLTGCALEGGGSAAAQSAAAAVMAEASALQVRRVWAGRVPNLYAASPSPDGRLVTEIDWSTGDLAVLDLETATLRRVTNKGTWADNTDYAEFSVFSPDGGSIAYTWFNEKGGGYEVRVVGTDGQNVRTLLAANPEMRYTAVEDWSRDGAMLLMTLFRADRSSQIATISVADGTLRVLKTSDWRHPVVSAFSPDGRYIAYDFPPDETDRQRDIFLMPAAGGSEVRLVSGPSMDVLLGWVGDAILFYSNRAQTRGIWRQVVQGGRPVGEPELVRPDVWQLVPLGFSRDAYYYGVDVELPQVQTATIDLERNRVIAPPAAVQDAGAGSSSYGAWSPDGHHLAYLGRHAGESQPAIVVRPVDGVDARYIDLQLTQPSNLQWTPDGAALMVFGTDRKGREALYRIDARSGAHEVVLERSGHQDQLHRATLAPDGVHILYKGALDSDAGGLRRPLAVLMRNLATGAERELHRTGQLGPGPVSISGDGRRYVSRGRDIDGRMDKLFIGSTDGTGELSVFYQTDGRLLQNRGGFPWTPDGRHVLAIEHRQADGVSRLLKVPVDGGAPVVLMEQPAGAAGIELEQRFSDLRLSPDGRRVSFGTGQARGEIWRIDGVGMLAPAARQAER
jgi:Tol biopolymer transport system component